jgi:hypothetical protein
MELKEAMMNEYPVMFNGVEYKCISGIIYRKNRNEVEIRAELLDKTMRSVSIVHPSRIERKEDNRYEEVIRCSEVHDIMARQ